MNILPLLGNAELRAITVRRFVSEVITQFGDYQDYPVPNELFAVNEEVRPKLLEQLRPILIFQNLVSRQVDGLKVYYVSECDPAISQELALPAHQVLFHLERSWWIAAQRAADDGVVMTTSEVLDESASFDLALDFPNQTPEVRLAIDQDINRGRLTRDALRLGDLFIWRDQAFSVFAAMGMKEPFPWIVPEVTPGVPYHEYVARQSIGRFADERLSQEAKPADARQRAEETYAQALKPELWTIDEAAWWLTGTDPQEVARLLKSVPWLMAEPPNEPDFMKQHKDLCRRLRAAFTKDSIPDDRTEISAAKAVQWAQEQLDFAIREALSSQIATRANQSRNRAWVNSLVRTATALNAQVRKRGRGKFDVMESDFKGFDRSDLLKWIAKFDKCLQLPSEPYKAAKHILISCKHMAVPNQDTLAKVLKEARALKQ